MSKQQIFYVCSCDEWKSCDSMRLVLLTTSKRRLKSFISHKIEQGEFEYANADLTKRQQAKAFREDFDECRTADIDALLNYAHFNYSYDGEEM